MNTSLEKMNKSVLKLLNTLTPEETYKIIVQEALRLSGGKYGSILLEQEGILQRVYTSLPDTRVFEPRRRGDTFMVFKTNKSKIMKVDALVENHPELEIAKGGSDIMIPLSFQNKAIGVLTILSKKKYRFTKNDLRLLQSFVPFATLAIKNSQFYEETVQALETRDLFISMASHELKTPITTINVYIQLIKRKILKNQPVESKWINPLLNEVTRLTRLINELLQVNQIKTGNLQYEWKECDIKEIVERAVRDFKITHQDYTITYSGNLTKGNTIWADYDKLLQILINILSNATKFSPEKSEVMVNARYVDNHVKITIADHGKGISQKDLTRIFDRFYRGADHTKEGMGLGLYLTKRIVDMHKGSIHVDSQLDKGTTVTLEFPLHEQ